MHPEDARPGLADRDLAHRREDLLLRARDQRRQVRGHAGLEQRLARAAVAVRVRVEEVDAAEAVHLQVDEARDGDAVPVAAREADRGDPSVEHLDVPSDEQAVDERCCDSELHACSLEVVLSSGQYQFGKFPREWACVRASWSIPSR